MALLSLAHLSMIDARPDQLIAAAAAGGFDGVGLRIATTMTLPGGVDLVSDHAARRDVRQRLADTGLKVCDVESFVLGGSANPPGFAAALDVVAELGAKYALCVADDEDPVRLVHRLAALCEMARDRDITIGVEFIPYRTTKTLGAVRDLLARADQPNAGLVIDALHLSRSGGKPEDLATVPPEQIAFVQLCDARAERPAYEDLAREARTDRLYPGEGALWLDRLLPMIPPGRHFSIENPVAADAHLDFNERGRKLGAATRRFLSRHATQ